jgi:signal transduction histidine kinase
MQRAEQDIRKRLAVARLPAMPQILVKLLALCQGQPASVAEAAQLVAQDPGMASTVLGFAHSTAYRRGGRDIGIMQALAAMGGDMFRTLVVNESVLRLFDDSAGPEGGELRGFWQHSLTAALAARDIAQRLSYPYPEEAYLAGLLHDVGRLALLAAAPAEYAAHFLSPDDAKLCWTEQRTLQITHGEAGAWLIERWQLDSFLSDSVLYHHEPVARLAGAHPLIRIGLLAHLLAGAGPGDPETAQAGLLCGLDADALDAIRVAAAGRVMEVAAGLGIDLDALEQPAVLPAQAPREQDPIRQRLSDQVRNMVLATNAERAFARQQGQDALLETILRSARLLFNLDDAVVLLRAGGGTELRGAPAGEHRQRLSDFSVPLAAECALARAAGQSRVAFIRRDGALLDVGEEQLLNLLGAESLVCVPLSAGGHCLGMIVGGMPAERVAELMRREEYLQAYAAQAGSAMQVAGNARAALDSQAASIADEFREAARKVAHEVNNPLSIIKNYLSILDVKLRKKEPAVGELSILNEEIDRVGQIIHGMADLQPQVGDGSTDVGRVVREVVRLFKDSGFVPPAVHVATRLSDQVSTIAGSPDLVKQILMNLIKNAVEAMPAGGEIEITDHGRINRDGRLYVELSIRDSGPGIAPDVLAHLFAPGYSTKEGEQRGLGLSIVHGLVGQMHGTILCRSGPAATTFPLLLPAPAARTGAGQAYAAHTK